MEPRKSNYPRSDKKKPFNKNARSRDKGDKKYGASDRGSRMPRKRMRRVFPQTDYKDTDALGKYLTEKGKILPRRITRLSAKDQRVLTRLIKKARHAGLLPFQAY